MVYAVHVLRLRGQVLRGPGIPFGGDFSIGFRGFNPNDAFRVIAVTEIDDFAKVPEPGTLTLFAGIGTLLVRRRGSHPAQ